MADAPLSPHLQSILFQHRLSERSRKRAPTELSTQVYQAPDLPLAEMPPPMKVGKPIGLTPDYKGSEIQAKYDTERMQQDGANSRAKLDALMQIEGMRFKMLARRAGGGHGGNLEAYLKTAAEAAKAPEGSAEREAYQAVLRTRYQGLPQQHRQRVEASGLGFDFGAKGPSTTDVKLKADVAEGARKQAGAETVARIGAEGRSATANQRDQTTRDLAAGRIATGEKPTDTLVRKAAGGTDTRAAEAERIRGGGAAKGPVLIGTTPDGKKVYRLPDGSQAVEE